MARHEPWVATVIQRVAADGALITLHAGAGRVFTSLSLRDRWPKSTPST